MQPVRRLYRDPGHRVVAGVAAGIAEHLGVPRLAVRIAFVALLALDGTGALLYAVFWAVLPSGPNTTTARRDRRQLLPFLALGIGVLLIQLLLVRNRVETALGWLVALIAVGAGLIWHLADPDRRRRWTTSMPGAPWLGVVFEERDKRSYVLRLAGGAALVIVGIIGVIAVFSPRAGEGFRSLVNGLIFALVALAGVALVTAPLLWRMFGQLRTEREVRIREQERAEVAAVVHDQVLHTLALIQRNAGDTKSVQRLARGQERSLRNWLYKPTASPDERLTAALDAAAAEIEDTYAIAVESVVVGDCPVDPHIQALVAAVREALVNAARHAKVETVSLYAEVEADTVSVFVRDRGVGFDPSTVDDDRHGVRGSILERMRRHGGNAEIRSKPDEGTEVRLTMPITKEADSNG